MAHKQPDKDVQARSAALVLAVNSALNFYYTRNHTDDKKRIAVSISRGPGGAVRTPEQQASYLLKGTSWTANSSHMSDGAKHILVKQGAAVVWHLGEIKAKQKGAFEVMVKAWNHAMKAENLRNFKRGANFDYGGSDPLHMELPNSRLADNDPRVIKTLEIYAKATRLEGKAKNVSFETTKGSESQKKWLQAYDQQLAQSKMAARAKGRP